MKTHIDKKEDKKTQSTTSIKSQKESNNLSTAQFVNNRPEAVIQRKLEKIAGNSPQVKQVAQLQSMVDNHTTQQQLPIQKKNNTGLPDNLKTGIENLSGYSMDDIKVHYNSDKPAKLKAHAYAQGTDIHIASGQEKHLPHEAWHVVQQKQGRVQATTQMKGIGVNDNSILEKEADVMGKKALSTPNNNKDLKTVGISSNTVQAISYYEYEEDAPSYRGSYTADTSATIFRKENVDAERLKEFKNWMQTSFDFDIYKKGTEYYIERNVNAHTAIREIDDLAEMRNVYDHIEKYSDGYVKGSDRTDDDIRRWATNDSIINGVERRKKDDYWTIKDGVGDVYRNFKKSGKREKDFLSEVFDHYVGLMGNRVTPRINNERMSHYRARIENEVINYKDSLGHTKVNSEKTIAARKGFNNQGLLDKYLYNVWRKDNEPDIEEFEQEEINTPTDKSKVRNTYFKICRLAGIALDWKNEYYTNGHGYAGEPNAVKIAKDMVFKNGQYKNGSYFVKRRNEDDNGYTYHKVKNLSHCSYYFAQGAKFTVITKLQDPDSIIGIATHLTSTSYQVAKTTELANGYLQIGDTIFYDRPNNAGSGIQEYSY
ncbi:eCIS core domain-containing protein [Tenacibaculum amylolyticum]|uniref:eCIS core domain-containing protein n=1 Tax=Tenacibaculum amylolyticum TaxID=104269 RepID=UPI003895429C